MTGRKNRVLKRLGNFLGFGGASADASIRLPSLPAGQRIYAVGDIHGRLDLFRVLIDQIEADDKIRDQAETLVILLGDLVDRGPESSGVIDLAREWAARRKVRHLMGNHEEMFLRALRDEGALRHFLRVGGRETILSYGIDREEYRSASLEDLHARLDRLVPPDHVDFLTAMEDMIRVGDYLFAHAGIDPALPVSQQKQGDLRWIREPFLSHPGMLDVCVVHGHTIRENVEIHAPKGWPNRIGIDTGAFRTGRLTAIGLQETDRWFIEATQN